MTVSFLKNGLSKIPHHVTQQAVELAAACPVTPPIETDDRTFLMNPEDDIDNENDTPNQSHQPP